MRHLTHPTRPTAFPVAAGLAAALTAALFSGCGIEEAPGTVPSSAAAEVGEDIIVVVKADGTQKVSRRAITRAQLEREKEMRAGRVDPGYGHELAAAIVRDPDGACGDASLWLFDQPNFEGQRLCLSRDTSNGFDSVSLSSFARKPPRFGEGDGRPIRDKWAGSVRSAWAGSEAGYFRDSAAPESVQRFSPWQELRTASTALANANILGLMQAGYKEEVLFFADWYAPVGQCQHRLLPASSSLADEDGVWFDDRVDTQMIGEDIGLSGETIWICRGYKAWPLQPGRRYDVTIGGSGINISPSQGRCVLRFFEGRMLVEGSGSQLWAAPLNLNTCRSDGF